MLLRAIIFLLLISLFQISCFAAEPSGNTASQTTQAAVATTTPSQPTNVVKPVIGIFLEAPLTYVNNEKVRKLIPEKSIPLFPANSFLVAIRSNLYGFAYIQRR